MSKAKLKRTLLKMSSAEITQIVLDLYDARKEAKEYLEYWLNPDAEKELEKCKKAVERQFTTPRGIRRRSPSLQTVTKTLKDFMALCFESDKIADLMLFNTETMCEWLEHGYRRLMYRTSLRKYLEEATLYIETNDLDDRYGLRLERLRERVEAIEQWQENQRQRLWWR